MRRPEWTKPWACRQDTKGGSCSLRHFPIREAKEGDHPHGGIPGNYVVVEMVFDDPDKERLKPGIESMLNAYRGNDGQLFTIFQKDGPPTRMDVMVMKHFLLESGWTETDIAEATNRYPEALGVNERWVDTVTRGQETANMAL